LLYWKVKASGSVSAILNIEGITDGAGSYNDNLFVERFWRTLKYEEVYLKAYQDPREARIEIGRYNPVL
jgi:putative transposase